MTVKKPRWRAISSSWSVVARLRHDGYPVIAAANPLRGLAPDADKTLAAATSDAHGCHRN